MSAITTAYRRILVGLALEESPNHVRPDGAIDKGAVEGAILARLQNGVHALSLADLRKRALRFTVYEHVRWAVRNLRPNGSVKGPGEGGARLLVPVKRGTGYDAKRIEDLTDDELAVAIADYDRRMDGLAESWARLQEEAAKRGAEIGQMERIDHRLQVRREAERRVKRLRGLYGKAHAPIVREADSFLRGVEAAQAAEGRMALSVKEVAQSLGVSET